MSYAIRSLALLLTILVAGTSVRAVCAADAYWPGWRGPHRDGRIAVQPPDQWPEQLHRVWSVDVGTGYASPLVSDGIVYQHARQGEAEVVWRLQLATGAVQWRRQYDAPFKMGGGGERHGKGPKSSPVLSDGRLFTMGIAGILSAWDTNSGDLLWRQDGRRSFQPNHPYWGAATSPLVDEDRVIVHFGGDERGSLTAFDVENGDVVWQQGDDGASYSSPLLVELHGVRQVVEWNHRALVGVESATGEKLWEHPFPHEGSNQNMPTPVFHEGRVLLGGENRGLRSLEPQLHAGAWTVKQRWHQDDVALDMSSAVINNDVLFGFSHYGSGRIFCLDPETGKVLWQGPGRSGDNVAFLSIPGYVVALIDDGELQIIRASRKAFEKVASYQLAESPTWAPPVLVEDGVLIKDHQTLTRFGGIPWLLPGVTPGTPGAAATIRIR